MDIVKRKLIFVTIGTHLRWFYVSDDFNVSSIKTAIVANFILFLIIGTHVLVLVSWNVLLYLRSVEA